MTTEGREMATTEIVALVGRLVEDLNGDELRVVIESLARDSRMNVLMMPCCRACLSGPITNDVQCPECGTRLVNT